VTPSPSQSALPPVTIETGQRPVASRSPVSSVVVGAIAVLLILAGGLVLLVRRWGHASPE
jgi:nitrate reductase gamma subunit